MATKSIVHNNDNYRPDESQKQDLKQLAGTQVLLAGLTRTELRPLIECINNRLTCVTEYPILSEDRIAPILKVFIDMANSWTQERGFVMPFRSAKNNTITYHQPIDKVVFMAALHDVFCLGVYHNNAMKEINHDLLRNTLVWNETDSLLWPQLCIEAAARFPKLIQYKLLDLHRLWCHMVWFLTDPPSVTQKEPELISRPAVQVFALLDALLKYTTPEDVNAPLCEKFSIDEDEGSHEKVGLFQAVLMALLENVKRSRQQGRVIRIRTENKINRRHFETKTTKVFKDTETAKQVHSEFQKETEKAILSLPSQHPPTADAYDRRIERLSYVALRLLQRKLVLLPRNVENECKDLLVTSRYFLKHTMYLRLQRPRVVLSSIRALFELL